MRLSNYGFSIQIKTIDGVVSLIRVGKQQILPWSRKSTIDAIEIFFKRNRFLSIYMLLIILSFIFKISVYYTNYLCIIIQNTFKGT